MKKFFVSFLLLSFLLPFVASAQILTPIKWTWKAVPTAKGEYNLIFTAKLDKGWHTYSQVVEGDAPLPTTLWFDENNKNVKLFGKATESGSNSHSGAEAALDNIVIKYFADDLTLVQKVKVNKDTRLTGSISAQACDDK